MEPKIPFQGPLDKIGSGPYEDWTDVLEATADCFDDDTVYEGVEEVDICEACQ